MSSVSVTLRVRVHVCLHKLVCVCEWNFIFVKFFSNYVAKFTFISQSSFWSHSQPWASLPRRVLWVRNRRAAPRSRGCEGREKPNFHTFPEFTSCG